MTKRRVLIIDDSATMRALIAIALQHPQIEVVGEAANAIEGRDAIKRLDPDVVTLDIEMPGMNGLDFLKKIMELRPTRVIIVSSLTESGADATIRALEIGAVNCIQKPTSATVNALEALPESILEAAATPLPRRKSSSAKTVRAGIPNYTPDGRVVAIGSSMGGVEALCTILSNFPANAPPTIITQHMPAFFTRSFAARLNNLCPAEVVEAYDNAPLSPGRIYLAPGGERHLEISSIGSLRCRLRDGEPVSGHRPSVDVMFKSVASALGARAIGVILTGMGKDGAQGLLAMRRAGARTVGQDEATSVVYGMPRVAFELGAVESQLALEKIAQHILAATNVQNARELCRSRSS